MVVVVVIMLVWLMLGLCRLCVRMNVILFLVCGVISELVVIVLLVVWCMLDSRMLKLGWCMLSMFCMVWFVMLIFLLMIVLLCLMWCLMKCCWMR